MILSHVRGTYRTLDGYTVIVDLDTNEVSISFDHATERRPVLQLSLRDAYALQALLNMPDTAAVLLAAENARQQTLHEHDADAERRENSRG